LLEIETEKQVANHPLRGALVENLILVELLKNRFNQGLRSNIFYWRDQMPWEYEMKHAG
jgi:predicted AAA+ superfamily ATPase